MTVSESTPIDWMNRLVKRWHESGAPPSELNEAVRIKNEIEAAFAEVSELRDLRDKIWLECKYVSPRIDEIRRLVNTTVDVECPESPNGEHVGECASGFPGFHDEPLQIACKYCKANLSKNTPSGRHESGGTDAT